MRERQAVDYLNDIQRAASNARLFTEGMDSDTFAKDPLTQHAVAFCHVAIAALASRLLDTHPEFATEHPDLPWTAMREMGDRIAHDFFQLHPQDIWDATQRVLPELLLQIDAVHHWRAQGE
ncbi:MULTISPECIES: DUF86 domain-containing protein [unclassified Sinorhizobium]|uniref:HepT-like ribonuclease domain-containing protein n=1 Tax=unclassified Sinorhizobium TaxID=2613772 RepID=UPI003525D136